MCRAQRQQSEITPHTSNNDNNKLKWEYYTQIPTSYANKFLFYEYFWFSAPFFKPCFVGVIASRLLMRWCFLLMFNYIAEVNVYSLLVIRFFLFRLDAVCKNYSTFFFFFLHMKFILVCFSLIKSFSLKLIIISEQNIKNAFNFVELEWKKLRIFSCFKFDEKLI